MELGLKKSRAFLVIILTMLIISSVPVVSLAGENLTLQFVSNLQTTLITNTPNTIEFNLYQDNSPETGNLTATITSAGGEVTVVPVNGTQNPYTLTDLKLSSAGVYTLTVSSAGNMATGWLTAVTSINARINDISGDLFFGSNSVITMQLVDSKLKPLEQKPVMIDANEVGANPAMQTLTTLSDGTFTFSITPTEYGPLKIIYGGYVIATLPVIPAAAHITTDDHLFLNTYSVVKAVLKDDNGNPLTLKPVTVDATAAEATPAIQNCTTLNDGSFDFSLTPTEIGLVKVIYQGNVVGTINVLPVQVTMEASGALAPNFRGSVSVKLKDEFGNPLDRKTVTVEGTAVGANPGVQNYTTTNDGIFTFGMIPAQSGSVKIIYAGEVVGMLSVDEANIYGQRIGGGAKDNASLSVAVAQSGWTKADNVILTRDDALSDALAAVPLSQKLDAPILMTPPGDLDTNVANEIKGLQAQNVYILGGTAVISEQIETDLKTLGLRVERLAGVDRYDTAARIAQKFRSTDTVYLAYGYGEADALAASAFAAEKGVPILLTETNSLPEVTQTELTALAPKQVVILGGSAVIDSTIENQLRSAYTVERWGGSDRYATEQIIFQHLFTPEAPVYFTSAMVTPGDVNGGRPFGDALLAASLAAKNNGFVVGLPPSGPSSFSLSSPPYNFLLMNKDHISQSTIVGNNNAVNGSLEEELQRLLAH